MKKHLRLAAAAVLAALCLSTVKPVRTWASQEGAYIYNQLLVRGPAYFSASRVGLPQGLFVSTNTISGGATSSGGVTLPGGLALNIVGGVTTAGRSAPGSATEGQLIYDPTVHSLAFNNGTTWYKLVDSGSAASWTAY